MTRLEAERCVMRALEMAEHALHNAVSLWGHSCTDATQRAWLQQVGEAREAISNAALPPAEPAGEVVELGVWQDRVSGDVVLLRKGGASDRRETANWTRLGTTRLPLTGGGA